MKDSPKPERLRKRYIVFEVKPELENVIISRSELIGAINYYIKKSAAKVDNNGNFRAQPWLIILENNFGLIRCSHADKDRTIELLAKIKQVRAHNNSGELINIEINTLGTSGTIKSARKKFLDKHLSHNI